MPPVLKSRQVTGLMVSAFIIAICGLVYELIIGTLSSYLFGNSVGHFSITIGLFMSAMGAGSYLSRWVKGDLLHRFVSLEIAVGLVGGVSAAVLYGVFATTELFYVAMGLLILAIGIFIGMEIPLITRLGKGAGKTSDLLANVLAFDYLGALLGSILFPLVLLPYLGLLQTGFAVGLLNTLVVGVIIWAFRGQLARKGRLILLAAVTVLILLGGLIWAGRLTSFFERQLYQDDIIYAEQSRWQRIVLTRWKDDVRLYLDGNLQFSTKDEYRYHESLVHPALDLARERETVLVLGGGDGLAAREILKYEEVEEVVVVDIDPAITELAVDHPTLREANQGALLDPRVEVVHQDAFNYVRESGRLFNAIIVDLPDPNNESLGKLYSRAFYRLARERLAAGGVLASQATSPFFARQAYWSILHTARDAGLETLPYHVYVPSFGEWGFFLAAGRDLSDVDVRPDVPTRFLTAEIFEDSQHFSPDMAEVPAEINTLDAQILLRYYRKGWQQW